MNTHLLLSLAVLMRVGTVTAGTDPPDHRDCPDHTVCTYETYLCGFFESCAWPPDDGLKYSDCICVGCPTGKYNSRDDDFRFAMRHCKDCPQNCNIAGGLALGCVYCEIGKYANSNYDGCYNCPAGHQSYSTQNSNCINSLSSPAGYHAVCEACAVGKYNTDGQGLCHDCPARTFADTTGLSACKEGKLCPVNHEPNAATGATGCSACGINHFRSGNLDVCQRCPTQNFRSLDMEVCNYCEGVVKDNSPTGCDTCTGYENYIFQQRCEPILRRKIAGTLNNLYVFPAVDQVKRDTGANTIPDDLARGRYLINPDAFSAKPEDQQCTEVCQTGYYADLCGPRADSMNVWLRTDPDATGFATAWNQYPGVRDSLSINTGNTEFLLLDLTNAFAQASGGTDIFDVNIANSPLNSHLHIMHEGKCLPCKFCGSGFYRDRCNHEFSWDTHSPPGSGTCYSCYPGGIDSCPANAYWYHKHPYGCTTTENYTATEPYECEPCSLATNNAGRYELVVGCGTQASLKRWHPRAEVDATGSLRAVTCEFAARKPCTFQTALYDDCEACYYQGAPLEGGDPHTNATATIPYCPPGWRVDDTCFNAANGFDPACCIRCATCDITETPVGACDGSGASHITCVDGCLPGEFIDGEACTPCGNKCAYHNPKLSI